MNLQNKRRRLSLGVLAALLAVLAGSAGHAADRTTRGPEQLEQLLERFPEADTDKDGKLTPDEARAYLRKTRSAKPGGATDRKSVM